MFDFRNGSTTMVPYWEPTEAPGATPSEQVIAELIEGLRFMREQDYELMNNTDAVPGKFDHPGRFRMPQTAVAFDKVTDNALDFTIFGRQVQQNEISYLQFDQGDATDPLLNLTNIFRGRSHTERVLQTMTYVFNNYRAQTLNDTSRSVWFGTSPLPVKPVEQPQFDIKNLVAEIFFPFSVSFLLPVFVYAIVIEKELRLREIMKMMGMRMGAYWMGMNLTNAAFFVITTFFFCVIGYALDFGMFTQVSFPVWFVLFVLWGGSSVSMAMLLSVFFSSTRKSTVIIYFLVIAQIMASIVFGFTIFDQPDVRTWHPVLFYSPWAFYRALALLNQTVYDTQQLPAKFFGQSNFSFGSELMVCYTLLAASIPVQFALAYYLDAVLPSTYGIPEKFYNPFPGFRTWWLSAIRRAFNKGGEVGVFEYKLAGKMQHEEKDVSDMRQAMISTAPADAAMIEMFDVQKKYGKHVAVKAMTFSMEADTCQAWLGTNGAGKTTTISMLSGLFPMSAGGGMMLGYDIATEMDQIHQHIGVCPQHDLLFPTLTCQEHLEFYARLKGVPANETEARVAEALASVGLTYAKERLSGRLSGGMKRRLSVANALMGSPDILILDEPTTGLDPASKRSVWTVLEKARKGRVVLLTSHSMEEAATLGTRICIMEKGVMRANGTPAHLRNRYGEGYDLQVAVSAQYAAEFSPRVRAFVIEEFGAIFDSEFERQQKFKVPREAVAVSDIFTKMEAIKEEMHIEDWAITLDSLESVFRRVKNISEAHDFENARALAQATEDEEKAQA